MEKKLKRNYIKIAASNIDQVLETEPHKAAAIRLPTTHNENYKKLDEPNTRDTWGEVGTSS